MYYENDNGYAELEAQWAYEQQLADKAAAQAEYEMELAEEDNRQQKLRNFAREILKNYFGSDPLSNEVDNKCLAEDYIQLVMFSIDETSKKITNKTYGGNNDNP